MTTPTPEAIADTLAYYHCRRVNPKADDPIMGYHTFSEDQREFLRGVQSEAAAEIHRMFATVAAQAKAEAWDEGALAAWERSTPTVNGVHYKWRHEGEPLNPYRAATIEGKSE